MVTVFDYLLLEDKDELNFCIQFSRKWREPIDHIKFGALSQKKFGEVKELQYKYEKGISFDEGLEIYRKFGHELLRMDLDKYIQQFRYLITEIQNIIEVETELLTSPTKNEHIQAGIDELNELGIYLQIRQIGQAWGMTKKQVEEMPYEDGLLELITQKRLSDFQNNLINLQKKHG